ncbi:MAG TPA: ABC transporter permease [Lachnospiraceae bacterium]|nr:ABC transporter permease [Lachnospiraceae bacterium]
MRNLKKLGPKERENQVQVSAAQQAFVAAYLTRMKHIRIAQISILVFFLGLWEVTTHFRVIDPFIFSSPSRIFECIVSMAKDGSLFYHLGITILETFISFSLVITLGIAIAVLLWWNDNVSKVLEPYLVILNSLPKSALAPVFIVWLGNNMKTIIVAAVSVAVFGSIITLYTDFQSVEEDKIKLIRTLGGTKKDILFKVVIPSNIPSIISVMKVNIGLSLVGVIIGEFLAAKAGLGYLIIYGSQVFKLDWVIMSIVILCILAAMLYKLLAWMEKKYQS